MTEGIILKGIGGFYYVDTPEGLIECKARGKFRKTVGKPIVGDRVQLEVQPDGTGYLMSIAPRRNSLIRPAVANLDLVVAVASAAPPVTDPFLIDKVTAIAVHKEITPLVVINKTDADAGDELYETYRKSGIEVLRVSARTGEGIDALRERICGKVSAFAGNSGVGKSSVLNRLDSSFGAEVGAISDRIGRRAAPHRGRRLYRGHAGLFFVRDRADGSRAGTRSGIRLSGVRALSRPVQIHRLRPCQGKGLRHPCGGRKRRDRKNAPRKLCQTL